MSASFDSQDLALCGCDSGLTYGKCHKLIDQAPHGRQIEIARRVYAQQWAENADTYSAQGLYDRLASELISLGGVRRILDVGCGLGQGLEALAKVSRDQEIELIGIDENPECLEIARQRLGLPGIQGNLNRIQNIEQPGGRYSSKPRPGGILSQGSTTLLQADVMLKDSPFDRWLRKRGELDAVTLWFSGVHKARSKTEIVEELDIHSDADHRERVEDAVLELAKNYLRPGGVVQFAGRGGFASEAFAVREFTNAYTQAGLEMGFDLISVRAFRYEEPTTESSISLRSKDAGVNALPSYAASMIFRAPSSGRSA